MRDPAPQAIRLADYRPPAWLVEDVALTIRLDPRATRVRSVVRFSPNPDAPGPFALDGEELKLLSARIDGEPVKPRLGSHGLACDAPDRPFVWECEVEIAPVENTALEGLYMSNGMYCTQCEAEGFRRITYYPDRPDVMAPFTVRIESDLPVLLSNGEAVASGEGWAEWRDPWPKPSYLFALVAGDLRAHRDRFRTMSGRDAALAIWTRPGPDEERCAFAMDALIRSMRWDEEAYGREYDLSVFNIVAVSDFNMGAMENKGLNIFNSSAVLASPETATDADFERIEAIVAHEYFHNWTGNRITCRDWFQLCLKEGLTVFRDQQFTAHERSAAVARIKDVARLRGRQFREDAGPLAHPVRPESFVEINNFYTATVYEKGAELVGMLRTLVGAQGYDAALALYFERHDGEACTVEDWLRVFEDATGRDLRRFKRWYEQAGTPRLRVSESWDDPSGGSGRNADTGRSADTDPSADGGQSVGGGQNVNGGLGAGSGLDARGGPDADGGRDADSGPNAGGDGGEDGRPDARRAPAPEPGPEPGPRDAGGSAGGGPSLPAAPRASASRAMGSVTHASTSTPAGSDARSEPASEPPSAPAGAAGGTYTLTFRQSTPPTPGQPLKAPLVIPVAVGLLDPSGEEVVATRVLEVTEAGQSFAFHGLARRPVPSILRGFSAPVIVERETTDEERAFLLAHDPDPFCRWEAGRDLARGALARMSVEGAAPDAPLLEALAAVAAADLDPAFRALCLSLPGEDEMARAIHDAGVTPDPDRIHAAHEALTLALARQLEALLPRLLDEGWVPGPYDPGAEAAGRRALGQAALWLASRLDGGEAAQAALGRARTMTEEIGALSCLLAVGRGGEEVRRFHGRWAGEPLVIDKWFALQVARAAPERAAETAARLTEHPDFDLRPNRFRAVLGTLAAHPAGFHAADGTGYRLLADWLIRIDSRNPQAAARLMGAFETWRRYDAGRQALMAEALERIAALPDLSRDLREMVERIRSA